MNNIINNTMDTMEKTKDFRRYHIRLTTLTPVHLGSGETIDFTCAVIDPENRLLYSFNLLKLVSQLNEKERKELIEIVDTPNFSALVKLQKFYLYRVFYKIKQIATSMYKVPKDLVEDYQRCLNLTRDRDIISGFNSINIHLCQTEVYTGMPYIPGSALKGALRTGFLEGLYEKGLNSGKEELKKLADTILAVDIKNLKNERDFKRETGRLFEELEKILLNKRGIEEDPFKWLRVSDLRAEANVNLEVLYGVNVRRENLERVDLWVLYEVVSPGAVFSGTLEIMENDFLNWDQLFKYNHRHYSSILKEEAGLIPSFKIAIAKKIEPFIELNKKQRALFLKLGRHSGAHALTIKGLRRILIRGRGNRLYVGNTSTTIWLASAKKRELDQVEPFGWVLLEVLEP